MTEQQYRLIADRDKGDDPQWYDAEVNDRVTVTVMSRYPSEPRNAEVVRIERPVPTTDEPHSRACGARKHSHGPECSENCPTCHGANLANPSVPTREQIADVLAEHYAWGRADDEDRAAADKVLALLNGADR